VTPPTEPPTPPTPPGPESQLPPGTEPVTPPAPSVTPSLITVEDSPAWKPVLETEDRADLLTGEDQEDAYGRLIEQTKALESSTEVEQRRDRVLSRLQKKQAFAHQRRTAESAAEKSEVVQSAFEIGSLHLEDNDPRRALNWVRIITTYDPQSSEAGNLTSHVVEWFHEKVAGHLAADPPQYYEAEKEFKRWRSLRPDPKNPELCQDEALIQELTVTYAKSVRDVTVAPYLKQELAKPEKETTTVINGGMQFPMKPDPEFTVADIAKQLLDFWRGERKGEAWDEIDIDIQSALTKRIKQAKAEQTKQSAIDMQVVIDAYDRLYRRNQSTVEFRQQLNR